MKSVRRYLSKIRESNQTIDEVLDEPAVVSKVSYVLNTEDDSHVDHSFLDAVV